MTKLLRFTYEFPVMAYSCLDEVACLVSHSTNTKINQQVILNPNYDDQSLHY